MKSLARSSMRSLVVTMAERVFEAAVISGAMAVDAAKGSDAPFDSRLHELRGQPGQIATARAYRELLAGSAIRASHLVNDDRVQDPYSLRCQPQVMRAMVSSISIPHATSGSRSWKPRRASCRSSVSGCRWQRPNCCSGSMSTCAPRSA